MITIALTPSQLRLVAAALGDEAHATDAADLRAIADRLDHGEPVTVDRPAYAVTYVAP